MTAAGSNRPVRATVVGSINVDICVTSTRLPAPGETVVGSSLAVRGGGKGANQAVALARLGAEVALVGAVGDDDAGRVALADLAGAGIEVDRIAVRGDATGTAVVTTDAAGENCVVVVPGANALVSPADVGDLAADVVVAQLELPIDTVAAALAAARSSGARTVLNAAPAAPLDPALLTLVDVLVVNEHEAAVLTGASTVQAAAAELRRRVASAVVVTSGAAGCLALAHELVRVPAPRVPVVDTVGAGDAFTAALSYAIAGGREWPEALAFATAAGALAVGAAGARDGLPTAPAVRALVAAQLGTTAATAP